MLPVARCRAQSSAECDRRSFSPQLRRVPQPDCHLRDDPHGRTSSGVAAAPSCGAGACVPLCPSARCMHARAFAGVCNSGEGWRAEGGGRGVAPKHTSKSGAEGPSVRLWRHATRGAHVLIQLAQPAAPPGRQPAVPPGIQVQTDHHFVCGGANAELVSIVICNRNAA